jgi:hypothetical protein
VLAAGQVAGTFQFRWVEEGQRFETVALSLPWHSAARTDVELIFHIHEPRAPQLIESSEDVRELGIKLRRLRITAK